MPNLSTRHHAEHLIWRHGHIQEGNSGKESSLHSCILHEPGPTLYMQAVPMYTVVVGARTEGPSCQVVTTGLPGGHSLVSFPLPGGEEQLLPGEPQWSNYVRGVVANFPGEQIVCRLRLDLPLCRVCFVQAKYTRRVWSLATDRCPYKHL